MTERQKVVFISDTREDCRHAERRTQADQLHSSELS